MAVPRPITRQQAEPLASSPTVMYGTDSTFSDCGECDALMDSFLCPDLSLATEFDMERDRRLAARMSRDQLAEKMDEMIQGWHRQQVMINRMLGEIRQLQVQLALAGPPVPARRGPEPRHVEWARELLGRR